MSDYYSKGPNQNVWKYLKIETIYLNIIQQVQNQKSVELIQNARYSKTMLSINQFKIIKQTIFKTSRLFKK